MPPKAKYSKEEIIETALNVVSEKGVSALTAKELSCALQTSTSPIFTFFDSMSQVLEAVKAAAMKRFEDYYNKIEESMPEFKKIGMQMILFAKEEPRLYQLIFMTENENAESFDDIYSHLGALADKSLECIQKDYSLSFNDAQKLFSHVWIHTFGIGTLCATGVCKFTNEQIAAMLTEDFTAMLTLIKSSKEN